MDYAKPLHRLVRILTLIQSQREWTPARLAVELGVTERTVFRDLERLKEGGVPVCYDKSTGQYCIAGAFFMPPVQLDVQEALALAALAEHVGEREQIPFLRPAWRALQKIESQLPAVVREELGRRAADVAIQTAAAMPADGYADVYDTVQAALAHRRRLLCKYDAVRSEGEPEDEFELCPCALFFSVRAWYVIGQRSDRPDLRCLKLNRFTKIMPTDRPYAVPDDFSLDGFLGNAWRMMRGPDVRVEIRFDPEFAQTVSDTLWHRTQEIQWHEDESCTFRCTVAGLDEIAWWVLSMGPHCTVIEPAELRSRVRDLARATAERYAGA